MLPDDRLHNDAGDFVSSRLKFAFECILVIEWQHRREFSKAARNARTVRQAERCDTGTRLHQKAVAVTVIAAIEFDDPFAAR